MSKYKKALEIMITKRIIWWIIELDNIDSADEYNKTVIRDENKLTDREFKLIKSIWQKIIKNKPLWRMASNMELYYGRN